MSHILRVSALLLLLIHLTVLQLMGFPRTVLVERFTNTYSDQCAAAYPAFEEFFSLHADVLSIIEYHTWFPVNLDPWYQFAPIENRERADYYAVDRLPTVLFDGVVPVIAPNGQLQLESAFSERAGIESPVQMELAIRGGDGFPIQVDLTFEPRIPLSLIILCALYSPRFSRFTKPRTAGVTGEIHFQLSARVLAASVFPWMITKNEYLITERSCFPGINDIIPHDYR